MTPSVAGPPVPGAAADVVSWGHHLSEESGSVDDRLREGTPLMASLIGREVSASRDLRVSNDLLIRRGTPGVIRETNGSRVGVRFTPPASQGAVVLLLVARTDLYDPQSSVRR